MMFSLHSKGISIPGNVLHLDEDGGYASAYICQNPLNSTRLMSVVYCMPIMPQHSSFQKMKELS